MPSRRLIAPAVSAASTGPRRDSFTFSGRIATQTASPAGGCRGAAATMAPTPCDGDDQPMLLAPLDHAFEHIDVADELGDPARGRRLVELPRRRHLDQPALVHHADPVGHRHRLVLVVGDDDEGRCRACAATRSVRAGCFHAAFCPAPRAARPAAAAAAAAPARAPAPPVAAGRRRADAACGVRVRRARASASISATRRLISARGRPRASGRRRCCRAR